MHIGKSAGCARWVRSVFSEFPAGRQEGGRRVCRPADAPNPSGAERPCRPPALADL
ncbi:hypothetical protein LI99_28380 [Mycolicibacterium smegmatis]|uniref:Uncharacterized protein n=1 Tax=Mycolicibacterium smegmatis (strain ATCC 700084 / mc(2)155) TaxID=246196 RepID=A0R483_MYCS2|nr:hypothetical protein MSMEG_5737 [Mycolicibacterium smegmatis MC2 155]AIU17377.1 hypothetical protein LI99_28380 [Mycolicibacterium smegmatis]AIU10752.1 hypothetical protein LJ00_28375 [Mycolicibacterium smegmatis MC2 155]AIU24000.1 hypothetical protein LI98_28385 [Mycolicibacterium smegmatis]TBH48888.1 hypothetical protein EYS45_07840 [Mycolicibacterium smegmatis MC2 155]